MNIADEESLTSLPLFPKSGEVAEVVASQDLIKILECPVCNAVPFPPIYGCFNGHIVCNSCRPKLRHCGLCRQPFWEGRSHVIESIVSATKFFCSYKDAGCDGIFTGNDIKAHIKTCVFGPTFQNFEISGENETPSLIKWVPCANGALPENPVEGGVDENGGVLYVARADHGGGKIPGKFSVSAGKAFIPWNCTEHEKTEYEILSAPPDMITWTHGYFGYTPPMAIPGGPAETGEMLYIGRWPVSGNLVTGKIHPSHRCCYIAFEGQELARQHYDVLTRTVNIDFDANYDQIQPNNANDYDIDPMAFD